MKEPIVRTPVPEIDPDPAEGLSSGQVRQRLEAGWANRTKGLRSTFILPLQTIGESLQGKIHSLKVEFSAPTATTK